jgi:predicted outer membrane repeat protein
MVKIWKNTFHLNSAIEAGGALASTSNKKTRKRGFPIILTECTFTNNTVSLPDSDFVGAETYGGAIDLNRASAKIVDSNVQYNQAEVGGGVSIRGRNCELEVVATTFESNKAAEGGGLYATGKALVRIGHVRMFFASFVRYYVHF